MVFHIFHVKNVYMALNLLNIYAINYDLGNILYHVLFNEILIDPPHKILHLCSQMTHKFHDSAAL